MVKRKTVKEGRPIRDKSKISVLFIDLNNDLQSQLAEYYTNKLFSEIYQSFSAGPEADVMDCDIIITMHQRGEDIRHQRSKKFESEYLPEGHDYDYVIYTNASVFDEYASKTIWKGKQILAEMGERKDFKATDDHELAEEMWEMALHIRDWVKENMADPEDLEKLVSA